MTGCKHESVEFMGEQKTDDGVNSYLRCKGCGTLLIVMPSRKVVSVPGVQASHPLVAESGTS
ncbi:MAG: hypothetical protein JRN06_10890 [Nitrososphaerota archaeon]|nr:hypothetical protein [Nitrososphaerota archaeon]